MPDRDTIFSPYTRAHLLRKRELFPDQEGVIDTALYYLQCAENAEQLLRELSGSVEEFMRTFNSIKERR